MRASLQAFDDFHQNRQGLAARLRFTQEKAGWVRLAGKGFAMARSYLVPVLAGTAAVLALAVTVDLTYRAVIVVQNYDPNYSIIESEWPEPKKKDPPIQAQDHAPGSAGTLVAEMQASAPEPFALAMDQSLGFLAPVETQPSPWEHPNVVIHPGASTDVFPQFEASCPPGD